MSIQRTDVERLRLEYRITGKLIGTPDGLSHQNTIQTVPLILMREEAVLLIERNLAVCESIQHPTPDQMDERHRLLDHERTASLTEYQQAFSEHTEFKLRENVKPLIESIRKKRKLLAIDQLDEELVIQERLQSIAKPSLNEMPYMISRACTMSRLVQHMVTSTLFQDRRERFCYEVFKKLYDLGFYLTSGLKFGCDYLAYKQDPILYHSSFLVICEPDSQSLHDKHVLSYNRLASQVKKSVLFAIQRSTDQTISASNIELFTIGWKSGRNPIN